MAGPRRALLGGLLGRLLARRPGAVPWRAGIPVVAVEARDAAAGLLVPALLALAEHLSRPRPSPWPPVHVVARGPGAPGRVAPGSPAEQVGAGPLLLSAFAPVWVARDPAAGARAAEAAGAGLLLLEGEGRVAADLTLRVREAAQGGAPGEGMLLSVGPPAARAAFAAGLPPGSVLGAELRPLPTGMPWHGIRALALASEPLAGPLAAALRALGTEVVAERLLEGDAPPAPALLQRLEAEAKRLVAQPVTTEADALRLPPSMRPRVLTLPLRLAVEDWQPFDAALERVLQAQGSGRS